MPQLTYTLPNDDIHIPTIYKHLKDGIFITSDASLDEHSQPLKVQDLFTDNNKLFLKLISTTQPHTEYYLTFNYNPKTNLTTDFDTITKEEFFTTYQSTYKNYNY